MLLRELGEFRLIKRIAKKNRVRDKAVLVSIGDDAAAIRPRKGKLLLATCDLLVEGVHFSLKIANPFEVGWKALASNISDIAAMGGVARQGLVSLGLRPETPVRWVDELYAGLWAIAKEYRVDLVGGDTVASPRAMVIDIALLGEVEKRCLLLRSGANVGDYLVVTGYLGDSASGLLLLKGKVKLKKDLAQPLIDRHLLPRPRLKEGRAIATSKVATSMIDISDGLAGEISHICEESKVGALIWRDKIPLSKGSYALAKKLDIEPLDLALYGGEDYELLFTVPAKKVDKFLARVMDFTGIPLTPIGEIRPRREGIKLTGEVRGTRKLKARAYEHFKSSLHYKDQ